jgi:hypothetical protein
MNSCEEWVMPGTGQDWRDAGGVGGVGREGRPVTEMWAGGGDCLEAGVKGNLLTNTFPLYHTGDYSLVDKTYHQRYRNTFKGMVLRCVYDPILPNIPLKVFMF